jgi:NADPH:quinone reductase-like Zn-dependent oxidoreductase
MKLKRVAAGVAGVGILLLAGAVVVGYATSSNECPDAAATPHDPMSAVVFCSYGGPEVLRLVQLEKPVAGDSQVLVRVHAASVNPLDWHGMRGTPYVMRLDAGLRVPAVTRLGVDFAGTVEAVGSAVTRFRPGDEVFGARTGALAEYVVAREDRVVAKPANLSFEQAAAVPVAALTALQGLRDHGGVQPGQRVLINGASGGVGTFAVQIAKAYGAHVTGVSSTRNVELVRSIGADDVVDYTTQDFTTSPARYDLIIDNVGNHRLRALRRVLESHGRYVMIGGPSGRWLAPLPRAARTWLYSRFAQQDMRFFISRLDPADLETLNGLLASGRVTPVIDRRYPLADAAEAVRYLETGRARGKVIVVVRPEGRHAPDG